MLLPVVVVALLAPVAGTAQTASGPFAPSDGCLVVRNLETRAELRLHPDRCVRRFSPCSTFKIPNAAFALETGVASGPAHVFPWDGVRRERRELDQDLTLARAVTISAVWVFQRVARSIGAPRMQRLVDRIDYGNRDLSGGIDRFWLASSLKISPLEQVDFLERLFEDRLPLRPAVQAQVRELMQTDPIPGADRLWAKTGSGRKTATDAAVGWYVGAFERGGGRWVFALNVGGDEAWGIRARDLFRKLLPTLRLP